METRTVLIADPCEEVAQALSQLLQPELRAICCGDGQEVPALLEREQPELLILELSLPRLDGIALLRQLACRDLRPMVLVFTAANTDFALRALRDLPVDYLMRKPTPVQMVAQRAREMLQPQTAAPMDWCVSDLLIRLSIPETSQGFRHLMVALPMLAEGTEQFLGKTLYMEIARRNRVTCESVEKAIRDAIHSGWDRGNRTLWHHYFPGAAKAPQNKPFLTRMAGILSRVRRCG